MIKPKILVILGSTREGRRGENVAKYTMTTLKDVPLADFELIDLRDWKLPMFDFAKSPSLEKGLYQSTLQKKWAKKIESGDGFIMITPEYNHGYSAVLKNAIDYLWYEWNKKPLAIISYGGISGGLRATEQLRLIAIELEMIPLIDSVPMFKIRGLFDENGKILDDSYANRIKKLGENVAIWAKEISKIKKDLP